MIGKFITKAQDWADGKLRRLAGKKPAFSHLDAAVDDAIGKRFDFFKADRRDKLGVGLERFNEPVFPRACNLLRLATDEELEPAAAVVFVVHFDVCKAVLEEPQNARDHVLAAL